MGSKAECRRGWGRSGQKDFPIFPSDLEQQARGHPGARPPVVQPRSLPGGEPALRGVFRPGRGSRGQLRTAGQECPSRAHAAPAGGGRETKLCEGHQPLLQDVPGGQTSLKMPGGQTSLDSGHFVATHRAFVGHPWVSRLCRARTGSATATVYRESLRRVVALH